jgi:hypothetical protein
MKNPSSSVRVESGCICGMKLDTNHGVKPEILLAPLN